MATKVFNTQIAEALITGTTTVACVKCGESNWSKAQPTNQTKKPGFLTIRCRTCNSKAASVCLKERRETDSEFREAKNAYSKVYHKERRETDEAWREAENARGLQWAKDNPGKHKAKGAKRRAAKLQATPPWSDLAAIAEFYDACPQGYHVDHVVPLQGELVCGLHVLENLQYLTASDNLSKSNSFNL